MSNDKPIREFAMPDYLVFLILGYIKELEQQVPDHILVKAVRDALGSQPHHNPDQLNLDL